jgi:hypothetical protein
MYVFKLFRSGGWCYSDRRHVSGGEDSAVGAGMTVAENAAKRENVAILTNVAVDKNVGIVRTHSMH